MTNATPSRRFAIALSFPGEHRRFVSSVATHLVKALGEGRVFYDDWYEAELLGLDGDLKLRRYYREESAMVVPFFSEHYAKDWCQIEWSAIRTMLKDRRKEDAVIPVQLDGTRVPGWEEIDFAIRRKSRNAKQIADLIVAAYRLRFPVSAASQDGDRNAASQLPSQHPTTIPNDISRIIKYAPAELIGREKEMALLNDAWAKVQSQSMQNRGPRPHIVTFVALGGEGKTSLVAKWAAELAANGWPGCDAVFAWSFYSQGTREQVAASSDLFLKSALDFFGDADDQAFAASNAGAYEKGERLARIIARRRCLLILDGLEPLQYAPSAPTPGELKDQGVAALLKKLAADNRGLCVVTTRYALPDLRAFFKQTVREEPLLRLSRAAGVKLLKDLGVRGSELRNLPLKDGDAHSEQVNEFEKLVEDVKGHALTLTLLGGFLRRAYHGDIRQRDRVQFTKADEKMDGGHALRTMAVYEQWLLRDGGDEGRRDVAVLRLLGLFDRPADAGCLAALMREPVIPDLTEPLVGLAAEDWEFTLSGLEAARLLTVNRDAAGTLIALDAHPHLREYFAGRMKEERRTLNADKDSSFIIPNSSFREAHRRLYEHLCETTQEGDQPTLEDLQPLYQAVAHGCQAGLQQEACAAVYRGRILRGTEDDGFYSTNKLGAFGSDLGAVACFFEQPWNWVSPTLKEIDQAWLLDQTAFRLRALGRLTEALDPMQAALRIFIKHRDWKGMATNTRTLSELRLTLGQISKAVEDAELSVRYADQSGDKFQQMARLANRADALHQWGRRAEAMRDFSEAERKQAANEPNHPLLYSVRGFKYCDLILSVAERGAWEKILRIDYLRPHLERDETYQALLEACRLASQRAVQTVKIVERRNWLLASALDRLNQGRAVLYEAILSGLSLTNCHLLIQNIVADFYLAGHIDHLPRGFLTRAWLRFLSSVPTGPDSAQTDLDEAWEIAVRGPMRLFLADIHLYRARLFFREASYPWESPEHDLAKAERLIRECGYHRRDEELADAKRAILGR